MVFRIEMSSINLCVNITIFSHFLSTFGSITDIFHGENKTALSREDAAWRKKSQ